MTVSNDIRRVQYATNGTTGPYTVNFPFLLSEDLAVTYADSAGDETPLTLNVDYTIAGSVVTTTVAYPAGGLITIVRDIAITQELDLRDGDAFPAESVERALDKLTMLAQQIAVDNGRVLKVPEVSADLPDLPSIADRASRLLGFDSSGNPVGVIPTAGDASALSLDLLSTAGGKGGSLVGVHDSAGYFVATQVEAALAELANPDGKFATGINALRYVPPAEWAAILAGTSTTDLTTYVQSALTAEDDLYFPAGRWSVSATTGLTYKNGQRIRGAGYNRTIFWAILATGGTQAEIVAYSKGSVFRRAFTPGIANSYVSGVVFEDFGIILNHPTASVTTTAIQVGIDLRNTTRSRVNRVHVGNYAPSGSAATKSDPPSGFAQQGYGIVIGTVSSGSVDYCGGEVNLITASHVWGAFKLIVQDDTTLSPTSAAHATVVAFCDLQGGHHGLVQESQYAAGCAWIDNTIQNCIKQNGSATTSYIERFNGYNSRRSGGYIEAGGGADYICRLDSNSKANHFVYTYYSATNLAAISDVGTRNRLEYRANTGAIVGGVDAFGAPTVLHNKAPLQCFWKGFWNGSSFTVSASSGMSLTRTGTGDYTIVLDTAQPNAHWTASVLMDTNVSGHGGTLAFSNGTQSVSQLRFFTYGQNAGTTTALDPRMMLITVNQMPS